MAGQLAGAIQEPNSRAIVRHQLEPTETFSPAYPRRMQVSGGMRCRSSVLLSKAFSNSLQNVILLAAFVAEVVWVGLTYELAGWILAVLTRHVH